MVAPAISALNVKVRGASKVPRFTLNCGAGAIPEIVLVPFGVPGVGLGK
jgi:hypothetical protein